MFQLPTKPQSFIDVILNGFRLWRDNLWQLVGVTALAVVGSSIPVFFIPALNTFHVEETFRFVENNLLFVALFGVIALYLFAVLLYRAHMLLHKLGGGVGTALWVGLKRLPYLVVALIIYDISVAVGLMLFVIPGIVLLVLLCMYFVLIVVDKENPFSAYKKSWLLVTGNWWHCFKLLFSMSAVFSLFVLSIDWMAEDLWVITHPAGGQIWLGRHLLRIAVGMLFYPIFCSTLLVLLQDLRLRKQRTDEESEALENGVNQVK